MASNSYLDNSGLAYFLTKLASWIPSWFPSQSGQIGKVLTTDGTSLSWTAQSGGSVMVGATDSTDGESGLVPTPLKGEEKAYLRGDGTWQDALEGRISNCLTQIPQDVKLELSSGKFTLKAGSKVYVPNGVGNFDVVTIESDVSQSIAHLTQAFLCFDVENNTFKASSYTSSGTTAPSSFEGPTLWYDTASNKIKYTENSGATWSSNALSLPIAIVTSGRRDASIDKVFNGFGYIGSMIFVLPNVKGLIPDGRNADGTLKNIPLVCTSVLTRELTGTGINDFAIQEGGSTIRQNGGYVLNVEENLLYTSAGTVEKNCVFARGQTKNGKILSLTPKTTFHAVDRNDGALLTTVDSLAQDGYIALDNGLCVQWGHASQGTVTFYVPFKQYPTVVASANAADYSGGYAVTNPSMTRFSIYCVGSASWFAVGVWK